MLTELVSICEGKDICVNVISKSGTTTEPAIAFRVFRDLVYNKYSADEAAKRIFATTDKAKGTLKQLADEEGYETFVVPDDVGGRFSVLTAVGLLPIAVAGIDIDKLMSGAKEAQNSLNAVTVEENPVLKYAAVRNAFYNKGTKLECFVSYEPCMAMFNEWLKQLFADIEGAFTDMMKIIESKDTLAECYFAENDHLAIGAIKALKLKGYRIPEDISIIGFDNIPECKVIEPALTTIHVPRYYIGKIAAETLLKNIQTPSPYVVRTSVNPKLIKRLSV